MTQFPATSQDMAPSLGALLRRSSELYADRVAAFVPKGNEFESVSYREFYAKVRAQAEAIATLGLDRGDRVAIMAENSVDWAITDWACQCLGLVVATIFPTLPADQAQYIVQDSGSRVVIVGSEAERAKVQSGRLHILSLEELRTLAGTAPAIPDAEWNALIDAAKPEDLATLIYTSGTSGTPKGVMLSHRALTWVGTAVVHNLPVTKEDTFLSFLPMSHCFERIDGQIFPISIGASIGYAKNLASLAGDIQKVKPTIMLVVPRFLQNVKDKVLDGVAKQPPLRQRIFKLGLSQGLAKAKGGFAPLFPITDKLVGAKIRERMGGRVRLMASGGAALPLDVAEFFLAFGIKVLQGYGLTESSAGITINHPDRNRPHTVGEALPGMEVKIAEDGEILLRGPAVMDGYYNLPDDQSLDAEGWFHTGDIGEFEGKHLKITDRKKDLIVLGNGKNVAPQPIEIKLKGSRFISEVVVLGDGMDHCVALVIPSEEAVKAELQLGNDPDWIVNPMVSKLIKSEIDAINKTLAPFEMVKKHRLIAKPFTVESGELTPSMKVKRRVVMKNYADLIREMM